MVFPIVQDFGLGFYAGAALAPGKLVPAKPGGSVVVAAHMYKKRWGLLAEAGYTLLRKEINFKTYYNQLQPFALSAKEAPRSAAVLSFLAGPSYRWGNKKRSLELSLLAGFYHTGFKGLLLRDSLDIAPGSISYYMAQTEITGNGKSSFSVKPVLKYTFRISRKLGVSLRAGYLHSFSDAKISIKYKNTANVNFGNIHPEEIRYQLSQTPQLVSETRLLPSLLEAGAGISFRF